MTKKELFKDIWNTASLPEDIAYKQWIKIGFDWMYGWYHNEIKAIKKENVKLKNEIFELREVIKEAINHDSVYETNKNLLELFVFVLNKGE
ncbi:hypothetical protein KAR91_24670 [Candidatus Pacearchaeota archaeon]|nr:hypothetical protein [Candidatus Pacearchaeota archaeon]